ncbi:MAG: hypothetical protein WAN72_10755 [Candidatus Acidiferrales bacterium]
MKPTEDGLHLPTVNSISFLDLSRFGILECVLGYLGERHHTPPQFLGQFYAFENLLLSLPVQLYCGALGPRLLAPPASGLVVVTDPPFSRSGHLLKDSTLLNDHLHFFFGGRIPRTILRIFQGFHVVSLISARRGIRRDPSKRFELHPAYFASGVQ